MYMDDYKRWLGFELEDPALSAELQKIEGNEDEIKDRFAVSLKFGTAELMLQTGDHPGKMKDAVCSPGGSTIQGVRALEEGGFRSAVIEAIVKTWEKNKEFSK